MVFSSSPSFFLSLFDREKHAYVPVFPFLLVLCKDSRPGMSSFKTTLPAVQDGPFREGKHKAIGFDSFLPGSATQTNAGERGIMNRIHSLVTVNRKRLENTASERTIRALSYGASLSTDDVIERLRLVNHVFSSYDDIIVLHFDRSGCEQFSSCRSRFRFREKRCLLAVSKQPCAMFSNYGCMAVAGNFKHPFCVWPTRCST